MPTDCAVAGRAQPEAKESVPRGNALTLDEFSSMIFDNHAFRDNFLLSDSKLDAL
jgi:hypothetical protein